MPEPTLLAADAFDSFPRPDRPAPAGTPNGSGIPPRVRYAVRDQVELVMTDLDSLLPADHPVRVVWAFVERQDWSALYGAIQARGETPGRPAVDPKILMGLWLYATLEGVGSARRLAELAEAHVAYRWLCGGVGVNYHTLSDFRVDHGAWLDEVLTQDVAALMAEGLVELKRVAQDGMRVRASAGAASYHRRETLERALEEARAQVEALKAELEGDAAAGTRREQAAQARAARERDERLTAALEQLTQLEAQRAAAAARERQVASSGESEAGTEAPNDPRDEKDKTDKKKAKPPRVSSTDPEVPVMKMADGGFRPAVNVEFGTDTGSQIITGVDVVNVGSDQGQAEPMVGQHEARYERGPEELLVDGGFVKKEDLEALAGPEHGCTVYAPVPEPKKAGRDKYAPLPGDSPAVAAWRERMGTEEAQTIYKERASTAECVNAIARNRGLRFVTVRGLKKIRAVVLWYVLAHNLMRAHHLRVRPALAA